MRAVLAFLLLTGCGREAFEVGPDHDGDGIADLGDNCPTKYDQGAEDDDGDGVGDACDPNPGTPGDSLASLTFFDDTITNWVPDTIDNWNVGTTTGAADATEARLDLTIDAPAPTIDVTFVVLDYGPAVGDVENALYVTFAIGAENRSCRMINGNPSTQELNYMGPGSGGGVSFLNLTLGAITNMRTGLDATGLHCSVNEVAFTEAFVPSGGSALRSEIIVHHLTVELQSVVVYTAR